MNHQILSIPSSDTTCYLLNGDDGYFLIDTGYDWKKPAFLRRLRRLGVKIDEIGYIFLTHHHDDHSGLLDFFARENPRIKVIFHPFAAQHLLAGENFFAPGSGIPSKGGVLLSHILDVVSKQDGTFPPYAVRETDIAADRDDDSLLRSLGIDGKILLMPGHTADSISVLLDDGSFFAGDAAMSAWYSQLFGLHYTTISIANLETYYESWTKIIRSGAKTIYPSHGSPFPVGKLEKNIRIIKKLEEF
ncbi:MAG: MBL fold metallo-hydrolase [Clostridiales Family XIII bacterium]|jgi:glyoxylase-like metal-dependent hydrolase (beta-lactamase superfamily II)|nr:MBL fold metallo-hydrolase [Clostridiales Family XIII bacterium]